MDTWYENLGYGSVEDGKFDQKLMKLVSFVISVVINKQATTENQAK